MGNYNMGDWGDWDNPFSNMNNPVWDSELGQWVQPNLNFDPGFGPGNVAGQTPQPTPTPFPTPTPPPTTHDEPGIPGGWPGLGSPGGGAGDGAVAVDDTEEDIAFSPFVHTVPIPGLQQ